MNHAPLWTTSSYGEAADTTPGELAALREHMTQCTPRSGRLVAMQCGALKLQGFVLARLVTTLAVLAGLAAALVLLL
jgi:hypothetical protein